MARKTRVGGISKLTNFGSLFVCFCSRGLSVCVIGVDVWQGGSLWKQEGSERVVLSLGRSVGEQTEDGDILVVGGQGS